LATLPLLPRQCQRTRRLGVLTEVLEGFGPGVAAHQFDLTLFVTVADRRRLARAALRREAGSGVDHLAGFGLVDAVAQIEFVASGGARSEFIQAQFDVNDEDFVFLGDLDGVRALR
jgi:hypothetical protein